MHADYHIEDLVYQNETLVVYHALTSEGVPHALVRLLYDDATLALLKSYRFHHALKELKSLTHSCLRPVLDGGLDPLDSHPWLAVRWWDGVVLTDRLKKGPSLTHEEFDRIKKHGSILIETLGPVASTISFTPSSVVTCGTDPAKIIDTFSIDYHTWFHAFSQDVHPATLSTSYQKFTDLLEYLRSHTEQPPATLVTSDLTHTPPLSTLVHPPSTPKNPNSTVALASATQASFPLKTILLVSTLLIGAATWFFTQKNAPASPAIATLPQPPPTQEITSKIATPKIAPQKVIRPKKTPPKKTLLIKKIAKNTQAVPPRPERPALNNSHKKTDITDPASLKKNVGQWIRFSGIILELDSQDLLTFQDSELRASLHPLSKISPKNTLGKPATIRGYLASTTLVEVLNKEDMSITYLPKEIYTVEDEDQLRETLNGETITLKAQIIDQTQSSSGKTLYLQLRTGKPEFAISIQISKAEDSLTEEYLHDLIGQTLQIKGQIKTETRGRRLTLIVTKKSQITVVE